MAGLSTHWGNGKILLWNLSVFLLRSFRVELFFLVNIIVWIPTKILVGTAPAYTLHVPSNMPPTWFMWHFSWRTTCHVYFRKQLHFLIYHVARQRGRPVNVQQFVRLFLSPCAIILNLTILTRGMCTIQNPSYEMRYSIFFGILRYKLSYNIGQTTRPCDSPRKKENLLNNGLFWSQGKPKRKRKYK